MNNCNIHASLIASVFCWLQCVAFSEPTPVEFLTHLPNMAAERMSAALNSALLAAETLSSASGDTASYVRAAQQTVLRSETVRDKGATTATLTNSSPAPRTCFAAVRQASSNALPSRSAATAVTESRCQLAWIAGLRRVAPKLPNERCWLARQRPARKRPGAKSTPLPKQQRCCTCAPMPNLLARGPSSSSRSSPLFAAPAVRPPRLRQPPARLAARVGRAARARRAAALNSRPRAGI